MLISILTLLILPVFGCSVDPKNYLLSLVRFGDNSQSLNHQNRRPDLLPQSTDDVIDLLHNAVDETLTSNQTMVEATTHQSLSALMDFGFSQAKHKARMLEQALARSSIADTPSLGTDTLAQQSAPSVSPSQAEPVVATNSDSAILTQSVAAHNKDSVNAAQPILDESAIIQPQSSALASPHIDTDKALDPAVREYTSLDSNPQVVTRTDLSPIAPTPQPSLTDVIRSIQQNRGLVRNRAASHGKYSDTNYFDCTRNPVTGKCITVYYDRTRLASNVVEAMTNFPNPDNYELGPVVQVDKTTGKCTTNQCRACAQTMGYLLSSQMVSIQSEVESALQHLDALDTAQEDCERLPARRSSFRQNTPNNVMDQCLANVFGDAARRRKRQITSEQGQASLVHCTDKGYPHGEAGSTVSLCTKCWRIRHLGDDHVPKLINEFACDNDKVQGRKCLSGYGDCRPRTGVSNIMRVLASGQLVEETIDHVVCCDCQTQIMSPMSNFIKQRN